MSIHPAELWAAIQQDKLPDQTQRHLQNIFLAHFTANLSDEVNLGDMTAAEAKQRMLETIAIIDTFV